MIYIFQLLLSLACGFFGTTESWNYCKNISETNTIDCSNQALANIPAEAFNASRDSYIKLGRNPYVCDCSIASFIDVLQKHRHRFPDVEEITCDGPERLLGRKIVELKKSNVCSRKKRASLFRNCKFVRNLRNFDVLCSGLRHIPEDIFALDPKRYGFISFFDKASLVCDCSIVWFLKKKHPIKEKILDLIITKCGSPPKWKGTPILYLTADRVCPKVDPCLKKPCAKDVEKCISTKDTFICEDIDECALRRYSCPRNSVCKNRWPGYKCQCNKGYREEGEGKKMKCVKIIKCSTKPCDVTTTTCVDGKDTFRCECLKGFIKDDEKATKCKDVDECAEKKHDCHRYAVCTNNEGSFKCRCKSGYKGNGKKLCVKTKKKKKKTKKKKKPEIIKCSSKPCGEETSKCIDGKDSFRCECLQGFQKDKAKLRKCKDIDECSEKKHDCHQDAQCANTVGGYNCRCKPGFEDRGDGKLCIKEKKEEKKKENEEEKKEEKKKEEEKKKKEEEKKEEKKKEEKKKKEEEKKKEEKKKEEKKKKEEEEEKKEETNQEQKEEKKEEEKKNQKKENKKPGNPVDKDEKKIAKYSKDLTDSQKSESKNGAMIPAIGGSVGMVVATVMVLIFLFWKRNKAMEMENDADYTSEVSPMLPKVEHYYEIVD